MNISGMAKGYAVAVTKTKRCTMHRADRYTEYLQIGQRVCKRK